MKQLHTPRQTRSIVSLCVFVQSAPTNECGEEFHLFWQENGVMKELFMAFVAEHR